MLAGSGFEVFVDAYLDYKLRGWAPCEGGPAHQSAWWDRARRIADAEVARLDKAALDAMASIDGLS